MRKLLRLKSVSRSDSQLIAEAVFFLWLVRLGLWLLPFTVLTSLLARLTTSLATKEGSGFEFHGIARCVRIASRVVPSSTCLTKALATRVMMGRRGTIPELRIGVSKADNGQLDAHAWLEIEGRVVLGKVPGLSHYVAIPDIDARNV